MDIIAILISSIISLIPSTVMGFIVWRFQRSVKRTEDAQAKNEAAKKKFELMLLKSVNAAIALGEATASAVERIPGTNCNGDMAAAKKYARAIKHEQKDFLNEQGIEAIF